MLAPAAYRPGSLPGPLPKGELISGTEMCIRDSRGTGDSGQATVAAETDLDKRLGFGVDLGKQLHLNLSLIHI